MPIASRPAPRRPAGPPTRLERWLERWGGVLPLFAAEFVIWLGFGGLLPVLPIYFANQGIDFATLGLVIAAWPAARLVSEPVFGWLADRTARVPLMVTGLVLGGVCGALPFVLTGPLWFLALRAGAGLGAAIYDPAARGYLTDATPPERRGEAFGLYGAAQMGGLLLGPTIGGFGAATFGGMGFVFAFTAVTAILGAIAVALRVREGPVATRAPATHALESTEFPPDAPYLEGRLAADREARDRGARATARAPARLLNRGLIAAIVINFGVYYASGTYEVVWSLFLARLGADLALIGLTFATFGLPVLLFSPIAGRIVDRRGALALIVVGSILPALAGILYTFLTDPALALPLILVESTGVALLSPALYVIVAANSPLGRSSTAQGLFGAAGTLGVIVAALIAGALAGTNILYPFYLFAAVMIGCLGVGLVVGGQRLRERPSGWRSI
jgi:MFS family permease